ncbi:uncharacterized protein LOC134675251 [Cydia fagiglandana]|uniref:uncharacterized protein LOC134675251 n=1 Tax=Cydia fagiglandana TaxID=1458189 RepID=UPI002FEE24DD
MNGVSHAVPKVLLGYLVLLFSDACSGLVLRALISQHGLHGEVEFSRKAEGIVAVRTALTPTLEHPEHALRWAVHTFPVDHRDVTDARCSRLGAVLHDLTDELGYLLVPGKDNAEFETKVPLTGPTGLWGRSLRLESAEGRVMCASILDVDEEAESYAEAHFSSPVAGTVTFRWLIPRDASEPDADVTTDLYHMRAVRGSEDYTQHKWKLFVTDIFDTSRSHDDSCDVLQAVFDPATGGDGISVGDLDVRMGLAHVARDGRVSARATYKHDVLRALRADMDATRRSLYVVVYDHQHEDSFLACAKLRLMPPQTAKVLINMAGVKGTISLRQPAPWSPTWATFELSPAAGDYEASLRLAGSIVRYTVRELPASPTVSPGRRCNTTGGVFNPSNVDLTTVPPAGMGTQDQYAVGDLLGKLLGRSPRLPHAYLLPGLAPELAGMYWDVFLPLRGAASVRHRALLVERRAPYPSVCGSVVPYESDSGYQTPMTTAEAVFRYPLVGRVLFRQPQERPWEDTTIIIESLIHADGANVNDTFGHRWALHERAPGADWYNWSRRCESAGNEWEPRGLQVDPRQPDLYCGHAPLCRLGDLTTRHGMLSVAGRKRAAPKLTRRLFSDPVLSLSGRYSALKRSLIILDDHGPVARGERMACSVIVGSARRKAVVHDWFGEGAGAGLQGKLEITQQSAYDIANLQLKLENLEDVRDYQIHEAPVEKELEFPCETSTLLEVYNPYNVSKSSSPLPTKGTVDEYAVGALGDKFGLLEHQRRTHSANNDTVLSLFGEQSVLGRSLLLARARGTRRWACGTLQRGYSPSEARELRAIASFHHPGGFAWGYVRMTQLVSSDGGTSDTVLELKLRYPGDKDRNMTHGHRWEVWVNPVGVDAAVAVAGTRCVAGGYRWNPYFTQLADPLNHELYDEECGADNPLRCDAGDLTSRLGTISVGAGRQVVTDANLPLEGTARALGRSLVVFAAGGGRDRLACANIEEDHDIVKYVNILKPPRFAIGQFLAEVRRVMGVPPWLLWAEARRSKPLHSGACLQLLLHFSGPNAARLEQDFTRLLATGRLDSPSIFIPGHVDSKRKRTTSYRQCGVADPTDRRTLANLEGPFLFFGPQSLEAYRRPALQALTQDELTRLYAQQPCVVVFNSQDGGGARAELPRLRTALRHRPVLALPQAFLDVHPDYVSNETQVLTLQGPWSERDAQMTETFARLQDIYGDGQVLGILGNSVSQSGPSDYGEEWRAKRAAEEPSSSPTPEDERPPRATLSAALFNASGQAGKGAGALVRSSGWPELSLADGTRVRLDAPVGEQTLKTSRLYTSLVVNFADDANPRDKITLDLTFKQAAGWWAAVGAEVTRQGKQFHLLAPAAPDAPAAVLGKAYRCGLPLVYRGDDGATLTFPDIQMQPYMDSTEEFADAFDCIGFTTAPIWSGLMVTAIMLLALGGSLCLILDIRTMDRFESSRGKQLTITVSE